VHSIAKLFAQPSVFDVYIYLFILHTLHAAYKAMAIEDVKYRYFIRKYM